MPTRQDELDLAASIVRGVESEQRSDMGGTAARIPSARTEWAWAIDSTLSVQTALFVYPGCEAGEPILLSLPSRLGLHHLDAGGRHGHIQEPPSG